MQAHYVPQCLCISVASDCSALLSDIHIAHPISSFWSLDNTSLPEKHSLITLYKLVLPLLCLALPNLLTLLYLSSLHTKYVTQYISTFSLVLLSVSLIRT